MGKYGSVTTKNIPERTYSILVFIRYKKYNIYSYLTKITFTVDTWFLNFTLAIERRLDNRKGKQNRMIACYILYYSLKI